MNMKKKIISVITNRSSSLTHYLAQENKGNAKNCCYGLVVEETDISSGKGKLMDKSRLI